jgi:hypothetical protein
VGFIAVLLSRIRSTKTGASSEEDEIHSSGLPMNGAVYIQEHFNLQAFFPIVALPMNIQAGSKPFWTLVNDPTCRLERQLERIIGQA